MTRHDQGRPESATDPRKHDSMLEGAGSPGLDRTLAAKDAQPFNGLFTEEARQRRLDSVKGPKFFKRDKTRRSVIKDMVLRDMDLAQRTSVVSPQQPNVHDGEGKEEGEAEPK